jgi:hypothetical protein
MAELSQEELLLLSILVYEDTVASGDPNIVSVGDLVEHYDKLTDADWEEVEWCSDFGFVNDPQKAQEMFEDVIDEIRDNEDLTDLLIENPVLTNDTPGSITAVCFVDPDDGTATVAFRGTDASYAAWQDNASAAGYSELSLMQESAVAYIEDLPYTDITSTGHSKGGNLAATTAIECPDQVTRVVSYDGQGFSDEYVRTHSDEIAAARDNITTIAAHNDVVHGLMNSVSGQVTYVENDATEFFEGHFCTNLLFDNEFDENGNFITTREQSPFQKEMFATINGVLKLLPPENEELLTDCVGIVLGVFLGNGTMDFDDVLKDTTVLIAKIIAAGGPDDWLERVFYKGLLFVTCVAVEAVIVMETIEAVKELVNGLIEEFKKLAEDLGVWAVNAILELCAIISDFIDSISEWLKENFDTGYKYATDNPYFEVDTCKLRDYAERLDSVLTRLGSIDSRLDDIPVEDLSADEYLCLTLADYNINKNKVISGSIAYLNDSADEFERIESEIIAQLGG